MTERERLALFEAAGLDKIVSQDFKTYLLTNGFFRAPGKHKISWRIRRWSFRSFPHGNELTCRAVSQK